MQNVTFKIHFRNEFLDSFEVDRLSSPVFTPHEIPCESIISLISRILNASPDYRVPILNLLADQEIRFNIRVKVNAA